MVAERGARYRHLRRRLAGACGRSRITTVAAVSPVATVPTITSVPTITALSSLPTLSAPALDPLRTIASATGRSILTEGEDQRAALRIEVAIHGAEVRVPDTYNGEPLADATVTFVSTEKEKGYHAGIGSTDANGEFRIRSYERDGAIVDPFGHVWTIATHVEDVAPEEMMRRMNAMFGEGQS